MQKRPFTFVSKSFYDLSLDEWYAISNLRERVFVVEQQCPYLDADGKDSRAYHIVGQDSEKIIKAYARIVHPDDQSVPMTSLKFLSTGERSQLSGCYKRGSSPALNLPAIGRVVLDTSVRGTGLSNELMDFTIQCSKRMYENCPVFLSAQTPLHDFYAHHGFIQCGPGYLEDEIPHIPMLLANEREH